jgi:hypothetical protein
MPATRIADELRAVEALVTDQHRAIERLLDGLFVRSARLRLGVLPRRELEDAIFELYVKTEEHHVDEECELVRLLIGLDSDYRARARLMLEEHTQQRALFLSVLDRSEPGIMTFEELIAATSRLASALRADIGLEEELLADLRRDVTSDAVSVRRGRSGRRD